MVDPPCQIGGHTGIEMFVPFVCRRSSSSVSCVDQGTSCNPVCEEGNDFPIDPLRTLVAPTHSRPKEWR